MCSVIEIDHTSILSRLNPPALSPLAIFKPFHTIVWLAIIAALIIVTLTAQFRIRIRTRLLSRVSMHRSSLAFHLWTAWSLLIGENLNKRQMKSNRFLFLLWAFMSWVIATSFSGNLLSQLLQRHRANQIDTMSDLYESSEIIPITRKFQTYHQDHGEIESRIYPSKVVRSNDASKRGSQWYFSLF